MMCLWGNIRYIQFVCITITMYREVYSVIEVDNTTCFKVYKVGHYDYTRLEWNGQLLPEDCRLGFSAPDSSSQTCITVSEFRVPRCDIVIKIHHNNSSITKTYTCNSTHDVYCADNKVETYMEFVTNFSKSSNGSRCIRIGVEITNLQTILNTIFGTIGGVLFICTCCLFMNKGWSDRCKNRVDSACNGFGRCIEFSCNCLDSAAKTCLTSCECDECSQTQSPREPEIRNAVTELPETRDIQTNTDSVIIEADGIITHQPRPQSATQADSGWAPPPYAAPPPYEAHSTTDGLPEAPPPSYYDVVTNKY